MGGEGRRQVNVSAREQKWIGGNVCENANRPDGHRCCRGKPSSPFSPPLPLLIRRTPAMMFDGVVRRRRTSFSVPSSTKLTVTVTIPPGFTTKGLTLAWTRPWALTADCEIGRREGHKERRKGGGERH